MTKQSLFCRPMRTGFLQLAPLQFWHVKSYVIVANLQYVSQHGNQSLTWKCGRHILWIYCTMLHLMFDSILITKVHLKKIVSQLKLTTSTKNIKPTDLLNHLKLPQLLSLQQSTTFILLSLSQYLRSNKWLYDANANFSSFFGLLYAVPILTKKSGSFLVSVWCNEESMTVEFPRTFPHERRSGNPM